MNDHRHKRGLWTGHFLAFFAGTLVTLSLAPFNIWPLGIVSAGLFAYLLNNLNTKQAAVRGWFYGIGLFGAGTSWVYVSIHVYGYAPVPLALLLTFLFIVLLAIFLAVTAAIYVRWVRDYPAGNFLGFAALFVLSEWWRSWFLTGFPWLLLGYGHIQSPLAGWAPVTGIFGLSFVLALSGAAVAHAWRQRQWLNIQLAISAALWIAGAALSTVDWVSPAQQQPVKVALVQANISQAVKWSRKQFGPTLKLYREMSEPLWESHDIVIWPEAAIPTYYQNAQGFMARMSKNAIAHNSGLISGIPYRVKPTESEPGKSHSSIMGFGTAQGIYHKQRLVPFGEYVPLEGLLRGLIQFFDLPMSAFSPGPAEQLGITANGLKLAPLICYEIVYPELVADWFPQSDFIVTVSNDAWFGQSIGPLQHLQMAQMRALENGRYLLRGTGTGVSAIVDYKGNIVTRGEQFSREIISGDAWVMEGATLYSNTGSWPILVLCLLFCITGPIIQRLS